MQGTGPRRHWRRALVMLAVVVVSAILVVAASELSRVLAPGRVSGDAPEMALAVPTLSLLQRPAQCAAQHRRAGSPERDLWRCVTASR